jgi:hypothetical protein
MGTVPDLFESTDRDADSFFTAVKTSNTRRVIQVRAHCEAMWAIYRQYADPQFLDEFPRRFHERWFEMYLTVTLLRQGALVQTTRPPGPDILVAHEDRRIWIEAICGTGGEPGRPDSIAQPQYVPGSAVVTSAGYEEWDKIALRIRNSIEKKRAAYAEYLRLGIVTEDDLLVIAANVANIPGANLDTQKYIFRALYGVGDLQVVINLDSREIAGSHNQELISVKKNNGAEVGTQPFVDGSMPTIAAALVSDFEAMAAADKPSIDLTVFPNLVTPNPWAKGALPVHEWIFESKGQGGWTGALEEHEVKRA